MRILKKMAFLAPLLSFIIVEADQSSSSPQTSSSISHTNASGTVIIVPSQDPRTTLPPPIKSPPSMQGHPPQQGHEPQQGHFQQGPEPQQGHFEQGREPQQGQDPHQASWPISDASQEQVYQPNPNSPPIYFSIPGSPDQALPPEPAPYYPPQSSEDNSNNDSNYGDDSNDEGDNPSVNVYAPGDPLYVPRPIRANDLRRDTLPDRNFREAPQENIPHDNVPHENIPQWSHPSPTHPSGQTRPNLPEQMPANREAQYHPPEYHPQEYHPPEYHPQEQRRPEERHAPEGGDRGRGGGRR